MTRRELAKFLTLGSGLLASVNVLIAFIGLNESIPTTPIQRIAGRDDIPPGGSLLFRYPTSDDPCILVRDISGRLDAYSQVCTHLSCAVVLFKTPPGRISVIMPCSVAAVARPETTMPTCSTEHQIEQQPDRGQPHRGLDRAPPARVGAVRRRAVPDRESVRDPVVARGRGRRRSDGATDDRAPSNRGRLERAAGTERRSALVCRLV